MSGRSASFLDAPVPSSWLDEMVVEQEEARRLAENATHHADPEVGFPPWGSAHPGGAADVGRPATLRCLACPGR
jgi:hypothetical protein